jgi:protein SCO1/2
MKRALALWFCLILSTCPVYAGLTETDIASVAFTPPANAHVPLGLIFRDQNRQDITLGQAAGEHATLLLPLDYACRVTCGPALSILASALAASGLQPGKDFRVILVGLDPESSAAEARAFTEAQVDNPQLLAATAILTGGDDAIRTLTESIGYTFHRDEDNRAFAHPTGLVALTADGRVARALSSLGLNSTDLRLALIEAGNGQVGGLLGRLSLICYGFDAVHGIYTTLIKRMLMIAGLATVTAIAGAIAAMTLASKRRGARS